MELGDVEEILLPERLSSVPSIAGRINTHACPRFILIKFVLSISVCSGDPVEILVSFLRE